jgi:hypothetical protein
MRWLAHDSPWGNRYEALGQVKLDAAFIACARTDIPALLAEIDRLRRPADRSGGVNMTPEERATNVAVRLLADYAERGGDPSRILSEQGIAGIIADAIRAGVAAELSTEEINNMLRAADQRARREERETLAAHLEHCAEIAERNGVLVTPSGLRHIAAVVLAHGL